jgi:hypothetical protein
VTAFVVPIPGVGLVDLFDPELIERSPFHHSPAFGSSNKQPFVDHTKGQLLPVFGPTTWPGIPEVRTLAIGVTYDPEDWPAGSTALIRSFGLVGVVEWGTGGQLQTAEFDFENGTQLAIPATVVRVGVRADLETTDGIPRQLRGSVTIANGCPARTRPPRRTYLLSITGDPGAPISDQVPAFARTWTWFAAFGADSVNVTIEFWSGLPGSSYLLGTFTAAQVADAYLRGQSTPVPNFARYWVVQGSAPGQFAAGQLSFNLDL